MLLYPDELDQVFDAEVGERHDAGVTYAVNSDDAVPRLHSVGHIPEPVLVLAGSFATDGEDGMNFVDVHGYAT
ncbi:hypothetical protein IVA80_09135 [Bradyrhizobium sp. 139]|uniref:hypothetical protein n=1 Tax=Bradyrhizobium sp. 139 TaxID=2782616 RepID=UPI0031FEA6D8|nr:hypothetical protein [Bradyrhizobium sp. 139]